MGARIKTLHIVGFKNSGKTTLVKRWIALLKNQGLNVAVIKHHGHGASLAMPDEHKDSVQYLLSGADASLVSGGGKTQYIVNKPLNFSQLIYLAALENPDVILVEGYKQETGDKVVLLRDDDDWDELCQLSGIQLVVGELSENIRFPSVPSRTHGARLDEWLLKWMKTE